MGSLYEDPRILDEQSREKEITSRDERKQTNELRKQAYGYQRKKWEKEKLVGVWDK